MREEILTKYFYDSAYRHEQPVSVTIELLTKCNMRCKHCYIPNRVDSGFEFREIKKLLYELRNIGVLNVVFTGGEIFLREDILDIIQVARKLHMRVILLSNGTLLNQDIASRLVKMHITQFSTTLFSLNSEIHDGITGIKGSMNILLDNLQILKSLGINVHVKTPLMNCNVNDYNSIKKYCEKNFFIYRPGIRIFAKLDGDSSPTEMVVSKSKLKELIREIDNEGKDVQLNYEEACAALKYSFYIDCHGDVYPCNSYLLKVGNVFEQNIKDIWYSSEIYKEIRNFKKVSLDNCKACSLVKYCTRCPAFAYLENRNMCACDSFAKELAQLRLENIIESSNKA